MTPAAPGMHSWMLSEDIEHSIFPISDNVAVSLLPNTDGADRRVGMLLAGRRGGPIEECLASFLRELVRGLLGDEGVVRGGVRYTATLEDKGLSPLPDIRLRREWDCDGGSNDRRGTSSLPSLLVRTTSPATSMARLAVERLQEVRLPPLPFDESGQWRPFDPQKFSATSARFIAEQTRDIGWLARGLLTEYISSYYLVQRQVRFARFLMLFRSELLDVLNGWLHSLPTHLRLPRQLSVSGLPTDERLTEAEHRLQSGSTPFREIVLLLK